MPSKTYGTDPMTPKFSHDLTLLGQSPYWDMGGEQRLARWHAFVDAVSPYATYDDLPPRLKRIYDQAYRLQHGRLPTTQG